MLCFILARQGFYLRTRLVRLDFYVVLIKRLLKIIIAKEYVCFYVLKEFLKKFKNVLIFSLFQIIFLSF